MEALYKAKIEIDSSTGVTSIEQLQGKLNNLSQASGNVRGALGGITGEIKGVGLAAGGLSNASAALSQAMSGNFVGAFRSATMAVRQLWAAIVSNPILLVIAGLAALGAALYNHYQRAKEKAEEAKKAYAELNNYINEKEAERARQEQSRKDAQREKGITSEENVANSVENVEKLEKELKEAQARADKANERVKSYGRYDLSEKGNQDSLNRAIASHEEALKERDKVQALLDKATERRDTLIAQRKQRDETGLAEAQKAGKKEERGVSDAQIKSNRQRELDSLDDPVEKLKKQLQYAGEDLAQRKLDIELNRQERYFKATTNEEKAQVDKNAALEFQKAEIEAKQKAYELERQITEEKKKQLEQERAERLAKEKDPVKKIELRQQQLKEEYADKATSAKRKREIQKEYADLSREREEAIRNSPARQAEAEYAFAKLSKEDQLKVVEQRLNDLVKRVKESGQSATDQDRLERINLLKQRDAIKAQIEKNNAKNTGDLKNTTTDSEEEEEGGKKGKKSKKTKKILAPKTLGGSRTGRAYSGYLQQRKEALGLTKTTVLGRQPSKTKEGILNDPARMKATTPAEKATMESRDFLADIAKALAGV